MFWQIIAVIRDLLNSELHIVYFNKADKGNSALHNRLLLYIQPSLQNKQC